MKVTPSQAVSMVELMPDFDAQVYLEASELMMIDGHSVGSIGTEDGERDTAVVWVGPSRGPYHLLTYKPRYASAQSWSIMNDREKRWFISLQEAYDAAVGDDA